MSKSENRVIQFPNPINAEYRGPHLLGPFADSFMIGGASLFLFAVMFLMVDRNGSIDQISWVAYTLSFIVNYPHFMASYLLLYSDHRKEIFTRFKFMWAGFIAPFLILAYMLWAISIGSPKYLSYSVNFMMFTVGWHYIKQIYGTMIVTSAKRGYYFTAKESRVLKCTLYPVWFMSLINGNTVARDIAHYGINYRTAGWPMWTLQLDILIAGASLVVLGIVLYQKWIETGKFPGLPAMLSLAAIYVWYLPQLYHAPFWYLIPFFHSLQYLLFVLPLKRQEAKAIAVKNSSTPAMQRKIFAHRFYGFLIASFGLGALAFHYIPIWLDQSIAYDQTVFGKELAMFVFITFINIHHYFIDNVIWRRDNPQLKEYLF